ncbi:MAG: methionyl-tRNA formyltransferase [Proteobacteria bacterium]|nr:methionyl-tRNA formyltransferase [Pseudomonadota bacterium]
MNIIFCGTPEFSVPPLRELIARGYNIQVVFTQADKPAGRGQRIQQSSIKKLAISHNIPVIQPKSLKSEDASDSIRALSPDLMVVVAYGLIVPQNILDIPKYGCWNIHASILPRWRGAAPIHRAILAGDKQTGISIMQMEAGLDTGPVFHTYPTEIRSDDTGQSLHDRLSEMGAEAIVSCVDELLENRLPAPIKQQDKHSNYAHKLKKAESQIDWHKSADAIERQVRAFNPWPGSIAEINNESYKIWGAEVIQGQINITPGNIISANKQQLNIQCGDEALSVLEIQKPGKKRMDIKQFMTAKKAWFTNPS